MAKAAAQAGDRDHAATLALEAEAELRTATDSSTLYRALEEVVRAMAFTGHPHQAATLAEGLALRLRASALGYVARHVHPADARPLIARALRLADWREAVDALAAVEPAALTDVAEAFLAETATR